MSKDTPVNEEAFARLIDEQGARIGDLIRQAMDLANGRLPFSDKASGMVDIAESLCSTITPYTPCGKGCNHCCYMAVSISDYEAEMIGRYLGRPLATKGENFMELASREDLVSRYTGVPCTLLGADGKCSVYPVRPIACRTHHNLAVDEENCKISEGNRRELPTTPAVNLTEYQLAQSLMLVSNDRRFGDVREFFP